MSLIDHQQDLDRICQSIKKDEIIGLDIEFLRHNTFYPILCLIQINISGQLYAIDPLNKKLNLKPFVKILKNRHIKKVLHSSFQDIWVFFQEFKIIPKSVFDTQIMANFLEFKFSISYAQLVKELLDHEISKEHQRSDWKQRPLHKDQLEYALNDVKYLPQIYQILSEKLNTENKLEYFLEEMKNILKKKNYDVKKQDLYKKFSLTNKSANFQANIKNLVIWRDKIAKSKNIPRSFVLKDPLLSEIAKKHPQNKAELQQILATQNFKNPRLSEQILDLLRKRKKIKETKQIKKPNLFLSEEEKALYKKIQNLLLSRAKANNIRPEFIVNQEDLKQIFLKNVKLKQILSGWRYQIFGKYLKNYL